MFFGKKNTKERLKESTVTQEHPLDVEALLNGTLSKKLSVNTSHLFSLRRQPLPIIFIPGIMGSRLQKGDKMVWNPDDTVRLLGKAPNVFGGS